ncbi:radical SAM protein [Lachnospiraceae bacterium WCA-9-b2]|uniref:Radical SAM protein n=1 Tax=Sporofaciens musculi TaxID=2681861 RepID=A0A7X3SLM1_9FIRM|nr:radical SAM protein [Sporofaciens musculi]MCI9422469.1 radical SAM protein [Dorea sp.]MXP78657.1 radical SAM protein [Sporofaciens musculi]
MKKMTCMADCVLCPRMCHANRLAGRIGYCRETAELVAARAALHMWEEECISGKAGSGTVFFSGCNLGCIFCQNHNISQAKAGKVISVGRLSEIFLELQGQGANNINLVTPTHYVPQIIEALNLAKGQGLNIPIVYNTSGYERVDTLRMLKGYVDIYLPDFKYMDERLAGEYSQAPDYPVYAKQALEEMVSQTGEFKMDETTGLLQRGVVVRHLVMPGHVKNSKEVIRYLYNTYGNRILISIMNQYTPMSQVENHALLGRRVTKREYEKVVDYALELGVECGYIQEGKAARQSFIPEFDGEGV